MANTKVTTGVIKDDAVGADQLASNAVVTASIVDNAITTAKINNDEFLQLRYLIVLLPTQSYHLILLTAINT